jgi:hypothetical protein
MDLRHPADPVEEAMLYHRADRFGFVPILTRTHDVDVDGLPLPVRPQRSYALKELPGALRFRVSTNDDVWLSQNEFSRPNRRLVNLGRITVCFSDLDYYKFNPSWNSPEAVAASILAHCADTGIPKPSLMIDSGRGLQIKWLLEPLPAAALPRWNAVQKAIGVAFTSFGSDTRAQDASRVLRLVGTYNTRSESQVRVVYADTTKPYDFDTLANAFLPMTRQELAELRAQRAETRLLPSPSSPDKQTSSQPASGLRHLSARQLWWDRLADIRTLKQLRRWDVVPEGHRDSFLWLSTVALSWVMPLPWVRQELAELGREFAGSMPAAERLQSLSTTLARAEQAARGETFEMDGQQIDPRYRMSNARLIELLGVTVDEQRHLKTIVSQEEARQRHAARERERRASKRTALTGMTRIEYLESAEMKRQSAKLLRSQGWSLRRIAAELNISVGSVAGYCQGSA